MHVAPAESGSGTDLRSGEKEIVAGLFALHNTIDHGLLLPAQVQEFRANPLFEVVDTPADLDMLTEFQRGVISFGERDFHLGGNIYFWF